MSDNTTTAVAEVKKPEPLPMNVRAITRNEVSLTPTLALVERGVAKGVTYPVVLPTEENWNDYVKFKGLKNVIESLAARDRQDAQATLNHVASKKDLWIYTYKTKKTKHEDGTETVEDVLDSDGEKVVEKATIALTDLNSMSDEIHDLLEKGSIRGGVTIKSLVAENLELRAELIGLVQRAATDPSVIVRAIEVGNKITSNDEEIARIQAERGKNKLEEASE